MCDDKNVTYTIVPCRKKNISSRFPIKYYTRLFRLFQAQNIGAGFNLEFVNYPLKRTIMALIRLCAVADFLTLLLIANDESICFYDEA